MQLDDILKVLHNGRPFWQFPDGTRLPVISGGDGPEEDDDAAAAKAAADAAALAASQQQQPVIEVPVTQPPPPPAKTFTAEDLERARSEEKQKLYDRIKKAEEAEATLAEIKKAEDARVKAEAKAAKEAEEAAAKKQREEMELRDLVEQERSERQRMQETFNAELQRRDAIIDQERRHAQLVEYRERRKSEVADTIIDRLLPMVNGNSEDEIEASIASLQEVSTSILNDVMQSQQLARAAMPGTRLTAPPVGPMENGATTRKYSAEDIAAMTPEEYAQQRDGLLNGASQLMRRS